MTQHVKSIKLIFDPLWGLVDVTEFLPMIDVPQFQALGFKYQLGVTSVLFPAATHTRKQHSFGAFKRAQGLTDRWLHQGFINEKEARLITAYALWHDIGHGPFSHVVEAVTQERWQRTHDENGAIIIHGLKDAIAQVGIDFNEFEGFFAHENPLYLAVHDKNLGAEKLDYLSRDAYYTVGERPGVEYLAHHTYFIDGKIAVDEKAIDQARALQEFYVKMFKNVYLRKNSIIAQRLMQKMIATLLTHEPMEEDAFWALTDFGLLGKLETSDAPGVSEDYQHFMHRDLPKTAIALRLEQFEDMEGHKLTSFGIDEKAMQRFISAERFTKPSQLEEVEEAIARLAKLPSRSVLVVPPASMERFVPQDIDVVAPSGAFRKLSDYFTDHFTALEEQGKSYTVLRVCTFDEHREKLAEAKTAQAVKEYLLSLIA